MLLALRASRLLTWLTCWVLFVVGLAHAQQSGVATVAFSCDFPGANPSHYGFSVTSVRNASYISDGKLNNVPASDGSSNDEGPFRMDFTLSSATTAHILDLAKTARYFEGNVDSKKKNVAS